MALNLASGSDASAALERGITAVLAANARAGLAPLDRAQAAQIADFVGHYTPDVPAFAHDSLQPLMETGHLAPRQAVNAALDILQYRLDQGRFMARMGSLMDGGRSPADARDAAFADQRVNPLQTLSAAAEHRIAPPAGLAQSDPDLAAWLAASDRPVSAEMPSVPAHVAEQPAAAAGTAAQAAGDQPASMLGRWTHNAASAVHEWAQGPPVMDVASRREIPRELFGEGGSTRDVVAARIVGNQLIWAKKAPGGALGLSKPPEMSIETALGLLGLPMPSPQAMAPGRGLFGRFLIMSNHPLAQSAARSRSTCAAAAYQSRLHA
jgi:hypothetical protein